MEAIIVMILLCVVAWVFTVTQKANRVKKQAASQKENRPADEQNGGSPDSGRSYNGKYKRLIDLLIVQGHPQYKIDWLLQSLSMGRELEHNGYYVLESVKKGLPYFCETEMEFDQFFDRDKPVTAGSVDGIMHICFFYHEAMGESAHPQKRKYWQDKLREMAESGNLEAQGALCSNFAMAVFSGEEVEAFRKKYESALRGLAASGNGEAQTAVKKYLP